MKLIGEEGGSATLTCRRDRLPKDADKKHFHHKAAVPVDKRTRVARFEQPVIAVKHVTQPAGSGKKDYTLVHISFQSTGGTNITTVNSLSEVMLYVRERQKGRGDTKRIWGIEMNEGRETYLKNYSAVDKLDQMLKEWLINYITWRWWHAPMRHGKAIAMCMAYQMYEQCAEGGVDPDWKLEKPMSAIAFRKRPTQQMCDYRPQHMQYPGDKSMRSTTQLRKKLRGQRKKDREALDIGDDGRFRVSYEQYLDAKCPRGRVSRLCSDNLVLLKEHLNSCERCSEGTCDVCGRKCYNRCGICMKHCCFKSGTSQTSLLCSIDLHNDDYFGLTLHDRTTLFGESKKSFKKPTAIELKKNTAYVKQLRTRFHEDMKDEGHINIKTA